MLLVYVMLDAFTPIMLVAAAETSMAVTLEKLRAQVLAL